jgi:3-phosphoshikimate 1-carboxyvinyltransferase
MSGRIVQRATRPLRGSIRIAPSKSVTHRALVAAALGTGVCGLLDPLEAEDTVATLQGLEVLGVRVEVESGCWRVHGTGGRVPGGGTLDLGESGTTFRFLAAVAALGQHPSRLDGNPRLRERPVAELASALETLGATVRLDPRSGGLPLVAGGGAPRGGIIRLDGRQSSQYASALLLAGPCLPGGLDLRLSSAAVSVPYVELTARVLEAFGVRVDRRGPRGWVVHEGPGHRPEYRIEGDHSSASYFLAAAAIVGGTVRVAGLDPESSQPDARLGAILEGLGCTVRRGPGFVEVEGPGRVPGFELDLGEAPDLAPTLAALALFASGPSRIRGIAHLRVKESDRLEVLAANLRRLGRPARAAEDALEVGPETSALRGVQVDTASDHRIAMAFAIAGLRLPGIEVDDPDCVAKSNPRFWDDLDRLLSD